MFNDNPTRAEIKARVAYFEGVKKDLEADLPRLTEIINMALALNGFSGTIVRAAYDVEKMTDARVKDLEKILDELTQEEVLADE